MELGSRSFHLTPGQRQFRKMYPRDWGAGLAAASSSSSSFSFFFFILNRHKVKLITQVCPSRDSF